MLLKYALLRSVEILREQPVSRGFESLTRPLVLLAQSGRATGKKKTLCDFNSEHLIKNCLRRVGILRKILYLKYN